MTVTDLPIDRWRIAGTLVALAPMAIRTGETIEEPRDDGETAERALIALDRHARPYVPATAIKGLVRSIAAARLGAGKAGSVIALFGDRPVRGRNPNARDPDSSQSQGGAAEFRDAFTQTDARQAIVSLGQTRIDRKRATAQDKLLRNGRFAAGGLEFAVEIVVDRASAADAELLCQLLASLDGESIDARIGGAGGAPVRFAGGSVRHWSSNEIGKWLEAPPESDWRTFGSPCGGDWFAPIAEPGGTIAIPVELAIHGHFLVSQEGKEKAAGEETAPRSPVSPDVKPADRAWLPHASFKGALRFQAERICRTLGVIPADDVDGWNGTPVEELFGSTRRARRLHCPDLWGDGTENRITLDMVAIDRLSGSVAGGRKFALEAWEAPILRGKFHLVRSRTVTHELTGMPAGGQPADLSAAAIGLLALLLRDLGEGEIWLGHGTRKGLGRVAPDRWDWRAAIKAIAGDDETAIRAAVTAFRTWAAGQAAATGIGEQAA